MRSIFGTQFKQKVAIKKLKSLIIWLTRNNNTFNGQRHPITSHQTITLSNEYNLVISKQAKEKTTIAVKWEPPALETYKLNVDASVK
ncbi:hypothetical protein RDI58_015301 [Solanum bulbocastanum]|uniref:Uncharacterized protein n=1 Tax=Solanum bulbocastanum TaxID=147425 RepID=A0AAN8YCR4_SOLBU